MIPDDTIVAISSAVGPSARMIVRLSGSRALDLTSAACPDLNPAPSSAQPARLKLSAFPQSIPVTLYTFLSPHSYTGEHIVEFHLPGNPLLAQMLLADLCQAGARLADAGEFTARAYFHGRIDLTKAEGVAATISAQNDQQLRAARQLLAGELAIRLAPIMDAIAQTLALVEVGIDFTEEDVTFLQPAEIHQRANDLDDQLSRLLSESNRFERLGHESRIVLVGRPNAGKSTLLNALAGRQRAVVSPIAGTTRDALSTEITLPRGLIQLVDVAGIEDAAAHPIPAGDDAIRTIHQSMRDRALRELERADRVVLVHDLSSRELPLPLPRAADLVIYTKADLPTVPPVPSPAVVTSNTIQVSAHTGQNIDALRHRLDTLAFGSDFTGATLSLNARHVQAIGEARTALQRVGHESASDNALAEYLAADLRVALDALGQILGNISPDELLGRIFSAFCIGK